MTFPKQMGAVALGAIILGSGLSVPRAQAAYTVALAQVGSNVVATGGGSIDLAGLIRIPISGAEGAIWPSLGTIVTGPATTQTDDLFYTGFTGPASFGSGGQTVTSSGSQDLVGIEGDNNRLAVPLGYISASVLSDSSTYDNQTFASLGVTPGTYTWTWSSDSFTLDIPGAAVPEASSLALLALPLGFVMLLAARPRRPTRNP